MNIERGIPIPRPYKARSETARTIEAMGEGDSVLVDCEATGRNLVRMGKGRKYSMAMRKVDGGWRVWRVS